MTPEQETARAYCIKNNHWPMDYQPNAEDLEWAQGLPAAAAAPAPGVVEGQVVPATPPTVLQVPPPPAKTGDLVVAPEAPSALAAPAEPPSMTKAMVLERLDMMTTLRDAIMGQLEEGVHYGTQPGVNRPFLWQAGGNLINYCYNVAPQWNILNEFFQVPMKDGTEERHYRCVVSVTLVSRHTGRIVYPGRTRSASSLESKYRVRLTERKRTYYDEAKKRKIETDQMLPAEPLESLKDSIDAVAQKRALVDAAKGFSAMDDKFAPDTDDDGDGKGGAAAHVKGAAPKPQRKQDAPDTTGPSSAQMDRIRGLLHGKGLPDVCKAAGVAMPLTAITAAKVIEYLTTP